MRRCAPANGAGTMDDSSTIGDKCAKSGNIVKVTRNDLYTRKRIQGPFFRIANQRTYRMAVA